MGIALDFSFTHPTVAELKAVDCVCVIRYVTGAGGKAATTSEIESYLQAGIVTCFVFENMANDASGGVAAGGMANARKAQIALIGILGEGWAANVPIYFAVDENVTPTSVIDYFVGINRVIPKGLVGVYADGQILDCLGALGLAMWFWQSDSKSFPGNATTIPAAHIQQKYNESPLYGTDLDILLKPDVGQWPRP